MTDRDAGALQGLLDLEAIRALKSRYARFCDDGYDPDGIASLFTEDGVWDGGELFGRCEGHEAIKTHFRGAPGRIPWALHYVLCPEIELDPDGLTARGSWYLWQPCQVRRGGTDQMAYLAGTYADTYVKGAVGPGGHGGWRFRTVEVDARWVAGPTAGPLG